MQGNLALADAGNDKSNVSTPKGNIAALPKEVGKGLSSDPKDINICRFEGSLYNDPVRKQHEEERLRRYNETGTIAVNPNVSFKAARLAVHERRYDDADKYFKETILAFHRSLNDASLERDTLAEYGRFLKSRHRYDEAKQIAQLYKSYGDASHGYKDKKIAPDKSLGLDTYDVRQFSSIYGPQIERRPKTSPTLPEGMPVPDNE